MSIFSSNYELAKIAKILYKYVNLPIYSDNIPGALLESIVAHVKNSVVLPTYDYIDIYDQTKKIGWSIKSTKSNTPVTWKRAKIYNKNSLINDSFKNESSLQLLGDTIIDFCNNHAIASMNKYNLEMIGYSRLILFPDRRVTYFERELCSRAHPTIFRPSDFKWHWSTAKKTKTKEQLPALHGTHVKTNKKWWAWHGLGENQLHFVGEKYWWPLVHGDHAIDFDLPLHEEKISFERFIDFLEDL